MIHVLLADDHTIIRDGLKTMLELSGKFIQVTGEASNGKDLLELLSSTSSVKADLVLMDINMPEMDGLTATRHIKQKFPHIKVIILSMMEEEHFITEAFQAGATGYLLKSVGYAELTRAIEVVVEGGQYISAQITLNLLAKPPVPSSETANVKEPQAVMPSEEAVSPAAVSMDIHLTRREIEVLKLIAQGYTNAQIADQLFTSKRTVENHRQSLLVKTGSKNTALLIRYALTHRLIDE